MADAVWRMTEEGEFELNEPYATQLAEARVAATRGWHAALIEYLVPRCPYTARELTDELLKRNGERRESKLDVFDEFVLEALSGDL